MENERVHIESDLSWQTDEYGHKLFDADGETLGRLPKSFTDDQIRAAVRLVNAWYARGIEVGKDRALSNLRDALGIKAVAAQ